jgi:ERCC4-type nuclease
MMYIDCREQALIKLLNAESKQLDLGDVSFEKDGQVYALIERKTAFDLASSLCDGRYQEQSYRLLESGIPPHRIVYLIEGSLHKVKNIPLKTLHSTIASLWMKGFSVIQTESIEETAEYLKLLEEKINKEVKDCDYVSTLKIKKKDKLTPENVDIMMLSQIPGVSTVTAKALLEIYGTMYSLTTQLKDKPDLLDSFMCGKKKISKKIIETLKQFLCRVTPPHDA